MTFSVVHRTIKIRMLETFLSKSVGNMIFPFMTVYLTRFYGQQTAGILFTMNVMIGISFSLFSGYFADRFGRRKILLVAEWTRCIAFMVMTWSNSPWLQAPKITFCMMMVHIICTALSTPANEAMIIDVSRPEERKQIYSILYWINNLSMALGIMVGGFLFQDFMFELCIALSVTSLIISLLITLWIKETSYSGGIIHSSPVKHVMGMISIYHRVFADKLFIGFIAAGALVLSMEFQLTQYVSVRLADQFPPQLLFGTIVDGVQMTALLRTINTILVVLLALFAAKYIRSVKDRFVLITSWTVFVCGYAMVSYANQIETLLIAITIASVAEVIRVPVEQSYLAALIPEQSRGAYLAVSGLRHHAAQLVCALTLIISGFVDRFTTSMVIMSFGLAGIGIFLLIANALNRRVQNQVLASCQKSPAHQQSIS